MNSNQLFEHVVRQCDQLPAAVRERAGAGQDIRLDTFDESYLDFLDDQIRNCRDNLELKDRLHVRRTALADYCNRIYVEGRIAVGIMEYWIKIDVESRQVFYWEASFPGSSLVDAI